jgi:hypothetical protein
MGVALLCTKSNRELVEMEGQAGQVENGARRLQGNVLKAIYPLAANIPVKYRKKKQKKEQVKRRNKENGKRK